jgi:hypothetical protein
MSVRSYWSLWIIFAVVGMLMFITDTLTMFAGVVFGFVAFGLTFMGMMNVLPLVVSHPTEHEPEVARSEALQPMKETPAKVFGALKSA